MWLWERLEGCGEVPGRRVGDASGGVLCCEGGRYCAARLIENDYFCFFCVDRDTTFFTLGLTFV